MGLVFVFLLALVFGLGVALVSGVLRFQFVENQAFGLYLRENSVWHYSHRWAGQALVAAALIALAYQQALERIAGVIASQSGPISCAALAVLVGFSLCFTGLRVMRHVGDARQRELERSVLDAEVDFQTSFETPVPGVDGGRL